MNNEIVINMINKKTTEILKNFIQELCGIDYNDIVVADDFYIRYQYKSPRDMQNNFDGEFIPPVSETLRLYLEDEPSLTIDKKELYNQGMILIEGPFTNLMEIYKDKVKAKDLLDELMTTILHEKIHANRVIMTNRPFVTYEVAYDESLEASVNKVIYADVEEDIYKKRIKSGTALNYSEYETAMKEQKCIDEALVELIAIISYRLFLNKSRNRNESIMSIIKSINSCYGDSDEIDHIKAITNIIIRHNNLDLLKWMISPLEYQGFDLTYDYFGYYKREEDIEDIELIEECLTTSIMNANHR